MATVEKFKDLLIWQKSRLLCNKVYSIVENKACKNFELKRQISASSGSVMDNIAEGFDRGNKNEFLQFLSYSKGSLGEVKSQLYRLLDTKIITQEIFNQTYELAEEISKMINSLIKYLKKTEIRGLRFKIEP
jgi:four helix bundle protein